MKATPPFSDRLGWTLRGAPFVDIDLLAQAPAGDRNIVRAVQTLRFTLFVILALLFAMEGSALFHVNGVLGLSALAFSAGALSLLLYFAEGLIIRAIVVAGATKRGWMSAAKESVSLVFFRTSVAFFAAAVIVVTLMLNVYRADVRVEHRRDWDDSHVEQLNAAQATFDEVLRPREIAVANLESELKELAAPAEQADTAQEDAEISRLTTLINAKTERVSSLEEERVRLGYKQKCEGDGYDCFGATGREGKGHEYNKLGFQIGELSTQISRLNKEIKQHKTGLEVAHARRNSLTPDAATIVASRRERQALRDQLVTAEEGLAMAAAGRTAFLAEKVPYEPPGVAEQVTLLWRILIRDPVNFVLCGLWVGWLFSLELTVITSAFTLRRTVYGISLRRQFARATTDEMIDAINDRMRLASTEAHAAENGHQHELFNEFVAAMRNKSEQPLAAE